MIAAMPTDEEREREIVRRNIQAFRTQAGMSQPELAARLGTTANTVTKWEQGLRTPERDYLRRLARVFGRQLDDFFSEDPPTAPAPPPQAFALKVLDRHVDAEMQHRAEQFLESLNREYIERLRTIKKPPKSRK